MQYIILVTSLLFLASCTQNSTETPVAKNTTSVLQSQSQSKTLYVDVREPSEWQVGHIDGAILVPLGEIEAGNFSQIPKDTPVSLYCRSGRRSGIAYDILTRAGYTNISNA